MSTVGNDASERRLPDVRGERLASSDNPVLRTLALCCLDAVGAVCDLYKITRPTHDLVVMPVYIVKQLIWDCFQMDGPYLG